MEVEGFDLLLQLTAKYNTDSFLYFLLAEAIQAQSDPHAEVLDRFMVDEVFHDKIPDTSSSSLIRTTLGTITGRSDLSSNA